MFDLEQSIADWRRQMCAGGLKSPAFLDELESHLRDAIAQQIHSESAASPAQAFASAVQQIGSADSLQKEFEKAHFPSAAQLRKWGAIAYSLELAAYTALQMHQLLKASPTRHEFYLGVAGLAATLLAAYGVWRLAPWVMSFIRHKTIQLLAAIFGCVAGLGWMAIFAWFILPYLALTPGQFAVVFLWALLPMVTGPAVMAGLDQPERERVR